MWNWVSGIQEVVGGIGKGKIYVNRVLMHDILKKQNPSFKLKKKVRHGNTHLIMPVLRK